MDKKNKDNEENLRVGRCGRWSSGPFLLRPSSSDRETCSVGVRPACLLILLEVKKEYRSRLTIDLFSAIHETEGDNDQKNVFACRKSSKIARTTPQPGKDTSFSEDEPQDLMMIEHKSVINIDSEAESDTEKQQERNLSSKNAHSRKRKRIKRVTPPKKPMDGDQAFLALKDVKDVLKKSISSVRSIKLYIQLRVWQVH